MRTVQNHINDFTLHCKECCVVYTGRRSKTDNYTDERESWYTMDDERVSSYTMDDDRDAVGADAVEPNVRMSLRTIIQEYQLLKLAYAPVSTE